MLAGCGGSDEPAEPETTSPSPPPSRPPAEGAQPEVGNGRGGVTLERIGRFEQPLHLAQPRSGDEALYVVEKCGRVVRLLPGREPRTFLDLGDVVGCEASEQGLLSIAFPPDYERSGRFYVDYTDTEGDTHVVEYRRSSDTSRAEPGSARELLRVPQPAANHNGGLVLFGPDGNLYVGLGDGGSAGDPERVGQDLSSLLGTILRIDPRGGDGEPYAIPDENPFAGDEGARGEILAYGLRNPWRFAFDPQTDRLWIADVGQSEQEEVNGPIGKLGAGANFGWSAFEGTRRFNEDQEAPDAIEPTLVYGRDRGCSVTGGSVVRDPDLPTLFGRYLYGDFCEGELRSFTPVPRGEAADDRSLGVKVPSLSSFGEDAAGRVYAISLEGAVYRLAAE